MTNMNMTFEDYVNEIVKRNMSDPKIRAAVAREERLGAAKAHRTSRAAVALENYGISVHPKTYHGGKMN